MNRARRGGAKQTWRLLWLTLASALGVALGTGRLCGQESGRPLHGPATTHSPLLAVASEDSVPRPPWEIRVLLIVGALAIWHGTQRLLGARQPTSAAQAEQAGRFLSENDVLLRLTRPANRFLHTHPRWANALLVLSS